MNSIVSTSKVVDERLFTSQRDIILEPSPPEEPSAPSASLAANHKYTEEEKRFFAQFITYHLNKDCELDKDELCDMLHKKVGGLQISPLRIGTELASI